MSFAEAKGKIAETELKILQVYHEMRNDVGRELREVEAKIGELVERKVAAEDQSKRIEIRAPQTGRVHELSVHTVGGRDWGWGADHVDCARRRQAQRGRVSQLMLMSCNRDSPRGYASRPSIYEPLPKSTV